MNVAALRIKVRERFNKLDSQDYENLQDWQIFEAFHKAQLTWVRQQLAGKNPRNEVDESSKVITDDLQVLLQTTPELKFVVSSNQLYAEVALPADYFGFKRLSAQAQNECCPARPLVVSHCEVANVDEWLRDATLRPSFEWAETFYTLQGNALRVYLQQQFALTSARLVYYAEPPAPQAEGVVDLRTGLEATADVDPVFSDVVCELLLDATVKILAGDTENPNQYQRASADVAAQS